MGSLRNAIAVIQSHALTAGAKEAPIDPPESNAGFPFSVCYPNSGTIKSEADGARRDLDNLVLDFHVSRQNLPLNVKSALDFLETFPTLIVNDSTLGDTVDTVLLDKTNGISYVFGGMSYASVETVGFRFTIPIKRRRNTT